ncbi:MAG: hypothetical protein JSS24_03745 [Proteobacteria bacterium]|nr:hypothetical protein [Pseudomonadota bacterium]
MELPLYGVEQRRNRIIGNAANRAAQFTRLDFESTLVSPRRPLRQRAAQMLVDHRFKRHASTARFRLQAPGYIVFKC